MRAVTLFLIGAGSLFAACGGGDVVSKEAPPLDGWEPTPWGRCQIGCSADQPVQLAAGYLHTCARMSDGTVRCWGDNSADQLAGSTRIAPISGLSQVVDIAAGSYHTCAVTADGAVYCWGANGSGQLGDDTTMPRSTLVRVKRLIGKTARRLYTSNTINCAVLADKSAVCWGAVDQGYPVNSPSFWTWLGTPIAELAIAGGILVRHESGAVRNYGWALGYQTTGFTAFEGSVSLASGAGVSLAVMPNGELRGYGYFANKLIQPPNGYDHSLPFLGGVTACTGEPCRPTTATWATGVARAVINKSTGSEPVYACLLNLDGTVSCFGVNELGQQGNGRLDPRIGAYYTQPVAPPQPVAGLRDIKQLVVGSTHACALDGANRVYCWGDRSPVYPSSKLGREEQASGSPPVEPLSFTP